MNENREMETVTTVHDLPPHMREPILADAKVFEKKYKDKGPDWMFETLALFKYQVEGAHERIDQLSELIHEITQALEGVNGPADDDDWWKR